MLNVSPLCCSSEARDLYQQLAALSVGQRLKLAVDTVKDGDGSTFKSDELVGATIRANKYHLMGMFFSLSQVITLYDRYRLIVPCESMSLT